MNESPDARIAFMQGQIDILRIQLRGTQLDMRNIGRDLEWVDRKLTIAIGMTVFTSVVVIAGVLA